MESRYQAFVLILAAGLLTLLVFLTLPLKPKIEVPVLDKKQWTLIAAGDVMLGRMVMSTSLEKKDVFYPWQHVANRLQEADLTFINLENPVVTKCPIHLDGFKFCTPPTMLEGVKDAGVDVVTLANNHIGNYGKSGIQETKTYLDSFELAYTLDSVAIKEINGVKVGFLGFNLVDRKELTSEELAKINSADSQVDYLIIAPHWGYEYQATSSSYQKAMAQQIIDHGADLIIGSHPHWVQERGELNGKPVYYSLGNFIFDQPWSIETRKGMAIKFTFEGTKLQKEEKMPIFMQKLGQPIWQ